MQIETARLMLRPPRLADVPSLFRFLGDRDAMRYTHGAAAAMVTRRGP
jgi:ribosomal-protein-alanine N-acetyltransferase